MTILLPNIEIATAIPKSTDVLITGLAAIAQASVIVGIPEGRKDSTRDDLLSLAVSVGAKAKLDSTVLIPTSEGPHVIVTGVGDVDVTHEVIRRAVGNGVRAAAGIPSTDGLHVTVSLDIADPSVLKGAVEGALLASYSFTKAGSEPKPAIAKITVVSNSTKGEAKQALTMGSAVAAAVCQAREWVNLPANLLYPETFAASACELVAGSPVTVEVLDEAALENQGYGGLLAVGGGSSRKPRLVRYSYAPRGAKFHLTLVGKGITFDTGGLNLKPADGMYTMKLDMGGAAAVLAATKGIADLGLKVKVTAYAAMAENLPSSTAYRPSDVLTMHGGKTVENANSDAEGRLVLADALDRASEDRPDMIVDVATLTGACMIALGTRTTGLMATDDETVDIVLDAAEAAGEALWPLPIPEEIRKGLESKVADLRSSGTSRYGGALTAGAFLQEFVGEGIPWAHLDIAGPAFNEGAPYDYTPAGGTGAAVRTLIALAHSRQS